MGKSSKKSATKADAAPVAVPQSGKKGKRGAENVIEKTLSAKKQKLERDETVIAKQKAHKKLPKKAASSSSEEEPEESDSDTEPKILAKKTPTPAINGSFEKSKKDTSSDSSDTSGSDSDVSDEKPVAKKQPAAVKNGSVAVKKVPTQDSSESSDSDSDNDEKPAAAALKNGTSKDNSSSEGSDSDSSEEEEEKKVAAPKGKVESSDSDSEEEEDSSDSDEEPKANKPKGTHAANAGKPMEKLPAVDSGSSDDESSDDEPSKAQPVKKVQASNKSNSSSDEPSGEEESDEEENEKPSLKTPKKDTDVEMVDAEKSAASTFQKTPKTPATPEATGSKTLFVGNLSFSVEESDVREFFKEAGEIVDVRFASDAEGRFRGFGHVEFATAEATEKAMELNGQPLLNRPVKVDSARGRGDKSAFTPQSRENNSFQKGGRAQGQTAFVRGFDTSLGEDEIRSTLQEHFGSCGEITRISIPKDFESGGVKGMAYMDFADNDGFNAALLKDGSELGGGYLSVQEAKPRGDSAGGSGGRFDRGGGRSGGRRGGRDGGRFGGRGGRDGGRFGGRGGRVGGRGRGRGTPYKPSVTAIASGKKTTFGED